MDDETFKSEVLSRLDQIIELLAASLPEACIDEAEPVGAKPEVTGDETLVAAGQPYLMTDEMRDDYQMAVQRWRQQKSSS